MLRFVLIQMSFLNDFVEKKFIFLKNKTSAKINKIISNEYIHKMKQRKFMSFREKSKIKFKKGEEHKNVFDCVNVCIGIGA